MKQPRIFPILLAAGRPPRAKAPNAMARRGGKTPLQIAVENCAALERPIVVLGFQSQQLLPSVPKTARIVINCNWRAGQITSLRAGLRKIPANASFLLYPVDLVFLKASVIRRLAVAFQKRAPRHQIVMPVCRGRDGHPVIFASELRQELRHATTARDVVYGNEARIKRVPVFTPAIWKDSGNSSTANRHPARKSARRALPAGTLQHM